MQRGVRHFNSKQMRERPLQHATKDDANDTPMGDQQDPSMAVTVENRIPSRQRSCLKLRERFRPGGRVLERIVPESRERLRFRRHELSGAASLPVAEVHLPQAIIAIQGNGLTASERPSEVSTAG
jgi:hypothetical protein